MAVARIPREGSETLAFIVLERQIKASEKVSERNASLWAVAYT
jgi:hypothetical protein